MNEMRQKFEARLRKTGYWKPEALELAEDGQYTWRDLRDYWNEFSAGYEAGEIAMKEKAARFAETHWTVRVSHAMPEVPANFGVREEFVPQTSLIPLADAIRALPLSGAEEAKKEK